MWNFQAENSLDQCLVKYRIMRPRHRTRELIAMARAYFTSTSAQFADTFREVIPGADSLIAVVVDSALYCLSALDNVCHGSSQVARVSRSNTTLSEFFVEVSICIVFTKFFPHSEYSHDVLNIR